MPWHLVQTGGDETAVRVAGHRVLDLDDLGAPLGQHRARDGHEHVGGDLEDADPANG